jgi:hypothetical protein
MRTTLTLDEDVAAKIDEHLRKRGGTFKDTVNDLLRAGLQAGSETKKVKRFKAKARALGRRTGIDYDNIGDLLEHIEGSSHR